MTSEQAVQILTPSCAGSVHTYAAGTDSLLISAARLLAAGDPLGALKRVALRDDPPALALRGIAMAQLGDYERSRVLLRRAARGFGSRERLAQARCQVAEAEVALAARDLTRRTHLLESTAQALDALGDRANALHAHLVGARRELLVGKLEAAEQSLGAVNMADPTMPPALRARAELTHAELALRRVRVVDAKAALDRAHAAAVDAGIPALVAEVGRVRRALSVPSARLIQAGVVRPVLLAEVEVLFASGDLIVDCCRRAVRDPGRCIPLAEGTLWVGEYRARKIHQVDATTGAILRTIESDRFVTGVTWVSGELWHGTMEAEQSELRHIDPDTGEILQRLEMPAGVTVSGLEAGGAEVFYCGGSTSGKVRAVRKPRA